MQSIGLRKVLFVFAGLVVAAGIFMAGYFLADCPQDSIPPWEFDRYCLFTEQSDRILCFALMREFERHKFIHRWFPKRNLKCGVPELKQALASLPKGTTVLWTNWPKKFDYPDQTVIDDLIAFAAQHDVRLEESPVVR